ncbi:hypothetical protein SNEBB_002016 [Seison nebaliae]|nr:hypothetical protein SNEBB_002016 [Seison nebaliae]
MAEKKNDRGLRWYETYGDLIPFKLFFFSLMGSIGSLRIFLSLYAKKQLDLDDVRVGYSFSIPSFMGIVFRLFAGFHMDHYHRYKILLISSAIIYLFSCGAIYFIPYHISIGWKFSFFFICKFISAYGLSIIFTTGEASCLKKLTCKRNHLFGAQRAFGSLAMVIFTVMSGVFLDKNFKKTFQIHENFINNTDTFIFNETVTNSSRTDLPYIKYGENSFNRYPSFTYDGWFYVFVEFTIIVIVLIMTVIFGFPSDRDLFNDQKDNNGDIINCLKCQKRKMKENEGEIYEKNMNLIENGSLKDSVKIEDNRTNLIGSKNEEIVEEDVKKKEKIKLVDGIRILYNNFTIRLEILNVLLLVLLHGLSMGIKITFLYIYIQETMPSTTKLQMAIVQVITCSFEFVLMTYLTPILLKKTRFFNIVLCASLFTSFGYVAYSFSTNIYHIWLAEPLCCLSLGVVYVSASSYASTLSKPFNLISTTQSLIGIMMFSIGNGCGALIGGYVKKYLTAQILFRSYALILSVSSIIIYLIDFFYIKI